MSPAFTDPAPTGLAAPGDGHCHVSHSGLEVVDDPRGGFVLALVVLLLFGIGVAGAAGYQVVLSEALLSVHAKETQTALSIARAGLRSYVGKQIGVHEDTVTYSIEGGDAVVTARLVSVIDDFETLYLLGSEGVYTDPTFTGSPARRTVYQYALKREVALDHFAALTQVSGNLTVNGGVFINGNPLPGPCTQGDDPIIGGVVGLGSLTVNGGSLNGTSNSLELGSIAAAMDSLGLNWDALSDPDFPVDFEDTWPSCALPADSFTVTRFNGSLTAAAGVCGRGVLIVTSALDLTDGFNWDGVVLAGHILSTTDNYTIDGLLVTGLDGTSTAVELFNGINIRYNHCNAFWAGKRLSHFVPVGSTWWEEM